MGTILNLIEAWLLTTLQKAAKDAQGTEWWLPVGRVNEVPICVKLQWEPGYAPERGNPFIQDGYGLTAGLFEEHSALLVWDWVHVTATASFGASQSQHLQVAAWLAKQFTELERKGTYERRHGKPPKALFVRA